MSTHVALGDHFETFIREQLESGRFSDVSEVVCAGLRLLEEREQRKLPDIEALREEIAAGRDSGGARPADEVFARLEAKYTVQTDVQSR